MCFSGNGTNQAAFLYGTLFMMAVPTTVLLTLGYLAYRRIIAIDGGAAREPVVPLAQRGIVPPEAASTAELEGAARQPVLPA